MEEPRIKVGICDGYPEIQGRLNGTFRTAGLSLRGDFSARQAAGAVLLRDAFGREICRAPEIHLIAEAGATFVLKAVTIGLKFHWERREEQTFAGDLTLLATGSLLTAINRVPVEAYLESVISSEMSNEAPFAFLRAHAIASRSWLVAMLRRAGQAQKTDRTAVRERAGESVRWYDREDHALFDVCADDHCQRYRGTGQTAGRVAAAVGETRGVFLISDGEICDARYHKACGGLTEEFATGWEEKAVPYLSHASDSPRPHPPLRTEEDAERWLLSSPEAFCNTTDRALLLRILPPSDRETTDFFRWQVSYGREELEAILHAKSGIDFGRLHRLTPVERGPSGRIRLLRIEGSKATLTVGKELEIRRWLSPSHLYSSAFIVCTTRDPSGTPARFILYGAGWGHGVGLCQVGAAVMAEKGFATEEILRHYFRGAALVRRY